MARLLFLVTLTLLWGSLAPPSAWAGDEDKKGAAQEAPRPEPEPMPLPPEPDSEEMSLGEEMSPVFANPSPEAPPAPSAPARRRAREPYDPDKNLDYSELLTKVNLGEGRDGVLPPALGFRGYRPNMVAASLGDRTPGYGVLVEYSWNRIGAGFAGSYRDLKASDLVSITQNFFTLYGLYRWLPFDFSPYFLLGLQAGDGTPEELGGTAGVGMEARIYSGWTALVGFTYHSTVHRGFLGGAIGWSF
jgi:hypothetical protein